jgi:2-polyprenyl-3-methyl-5-hydroxy-6-metoxy-1,4-benzoquinol methylase
MTSTHRTSQFFSQYASGFEAIYGNQNTAVNYAINTLFRGVMKDRFERTISRCMPIEGASVLDIGCGPGHYSVKLAERGAGEVLGLDFAPTMLALAKQRAATANVAEQCTWSQQDFLTAQFERTFDYVIAMGFMDYIEDPTSIVKKIAEVTKRRAFIGFPRDGGLLAWQRKVRYRSRCDLYLYSRERVQAILNAAGKPYTIEPNGREFFVTLYGS